VLLLRRGPSDASARLTVAGDDVRTFDLDLGRRNTGFQWLGGDRVAVGALGDGRAIGDVSYIVDITHGTVVGRADGILPLVRRLLDPTGSSTPSTAFVEAHRRIVMRPDLAR
jgi:hypothetical protein